MLSFLPLCVSVHMPVYVFCFVFRGKKTNPRHTLPAFRHLPEPWKPGIPLDRKGFRLDLTSVSRGCQILRARRAESAAERGGRGPREDGPALGPSLPSF